MTYYKYDFFCVPNCVFYLLLPYTYEINRAENKRPSFEKKEFIQATIVSLSQKGSEFIKNYNNLLKSTTMAFKKD